MTNFVAVVFGKDGTEGDSMFAPEMKYPYHDGMTLDEIKQLVAHDEDWNYIVEDGGLDEIAGAWVVDEKTYELITNIDGDFGSDSSLYRAIHTMKRQLKKAAERVIK